VRRSPNVAQHCARRHRARRRCWDRHLYRHFPTRQDPARGAFLDEALELRARAVALADAPSTFDALSAGSDFSATLVLTVAAWVPPSMNAKHTERHGDPNRLCEHARRGRRSCWSTAVGDEVAADVEFVDVLRLIHGIVLANEQAPDARRVEECSTWSSPVFERNAALSRGPTIHRSSRGANHVREGCVQGRRVRGIEMPSWATTAGGSLSPQCAAHDHGRSVRYSPGVHPRHFACA